MAEVVGRAQVIDGDTLEVAGERVRLHGIDAPEMSQVCRLDHSEYPCGKRAAAWLAERTKGHVVRCAGDRRDRYGRLLAVCRTGEIELNDALVRAGWAVAYRRYSREHVEAESRAQRDREGMWAGRFARPSEWRRGNREPARPVLIAVCTIKGNVNSRGQRIYHRPGDPHYHRVLIRPYEGDRCFASEHEALASGFRAALR